MLDANVPGRVVRAVKLSGKRLRGPVSPASSRRLVGRRVERTGRVGKYLFLHFDSGLTMLSHLGMSGRWLFSEGPPEAKLSHVHVTLDFEDGSVLRFQDPRRFGMMRVVPTATLDREPELAELGPDPVAEPPDGPALRARARGRTVAIKTFLLDQRQVAGIGNIYASEILHRARVHPARRAGRLDGAEWSAIARETSLVLEEAISRFGTTFSMYRTLWNEPGQYGDRLRVYDRDGKPCRNCGRPIRRVVQGQRSTFFCPTCQPLRRPTTRKK
jgi:formamidopyrimidine-DNA glycosylase